MADKNVVKPKQTKLIEWRDDDGPHKVILPLGCDDVSLGVPVGYPFESVSFPDVTPMRVARALHEHGIWTARDLRDNIKTARAAILSMTNEALTALLNAVREVDR